MVYFDEDAYAEQLDQQYQIGYEMGRIRGQSDLAKAQREQRERLDRPIPAPRWTRAGFWALVLLVAVTGVFKIAAHDVNRVDTFCWGVCAMSVAIRVTGLRWPR